MPVAPGAIVGILLAAGRGTRFDSSGRTSKLLAASPAGPQTGAPLALAAARALQAGLPQVVAVVRPVDSPLQEELHRLLREAGCTLVVNESADAGMGGSIAVGVRASTDAAGWLVALADMPAITPATIGAVRDVLAHGAQTAAPMHQGRRGHPVGFAARLRPLLLALHGDEGARSVLAAHPPLPIAVDDPGCLLDLDSAADFIAPRA
jgi:molybdenum cofactor cytidylyltransferase